MNPLDEIANLMVSSMPPEKILAYEIPQQLIERYVSLVDKEKNNQISEEDKIELDGLLVVNHVISMAKLMAVRKLAAA